MHIWVAGNWKHLVVNYRFVRLLLHICSWCCTNNIYTVRCGYNAVTFLPNPHKMHPIARPLGIYFVGSNSDLYCMHSTVLWKYDEMFPVKILQSPIVHATRNVTDFNIPLHWCMFFLNIWTTKTVLYYTVNIVLDRTIRQSSVLTPVRINTLSTSLINHASVLSASRDSFQRNETYICNWNWLKPISEWWHRTGSNMIYVYHISKILGCTVQRTITNHKRQACMKIDIRLKVSNQ